MTEPQPAPVLAALLLPMPKIRTVTALRRKRDEIFASTRLYEKKLDQARADLAHVTAAARIFAGLTDRKTFPAVRTPIACSTGASHGPAAPLDSPRRRRQRSELALALMNARYLPSNHQKSKLTIPADVIREVRNIALYNDHRFKKILAVARSLLDGVLPLHSKLDFGQF